MILVKRGQGGEIGWRRGIEEKRRRGEDTVVDDVVKGKRKNAGVDVKDLTSVANGGGGYTLKKNPPMWIESVPSGQHKFTKRMVCVCVWGGGGLQGEFLV